jgi:hypothetical protein
MLFLHWRVNISFRQEKMGGIQHPNLPYVDTENIIDVTIMTQNNASELKFSAAQSGDWLSLQ